MAVPSRKRKSDMVQDAETWELIHAERAELAQLLSGLSPEQWAAPSLCAGWSVRQVAAHVLVAAEHTPAHFFRGLAMSGFRFNAMTRRDVEALSALSEEELIERLRARTTTTNGPPAPAVAMLGEVVVHGEDIRRPLGVQHEVTAAALLACLEMYKGSSFPVAGKRRIAGLHLRATDSSWESGSGPEVSGPAIALVLAMTGRAVGLAALDGDGLETLRARLVS
jgi:uncharacterized protein (TIGR03083 family)